MVKTCRNFSDFLFCVKSNLFWFETILKFRKSSSSKRALSPSINFSVFNNCESLVTTTSYLVHPTVTGNSFNEYRWVLKFNWFSNSKLSMLVRTHRVYEVRFYKIMSVKFQIFLTSDKSSMLQTARNLPYRDIVRAESWDWERILHKKLLFLMFCGSETKLTTIVVTPWKYLSVELGICLDVYDTGTFHVTCSDNVGGFAVSASEWVLACVVKCLLARTAKLKRWWLFFW